MTHGEVATLVDELHESWYPALVRYAARVTGSLEMAEDLVQETLLELCSQLSRGAEIRSPKAWTLQVLRHRISKRLCLDKDRGVTLEPIDPVLPVLAVEPDAVPEELSRLLACLTTREEEVILLRLEGHRYLEIADCLGVSRETVKTLLARAMKKMQAVRSRESRWTERMKDAERRPPKTH